MRLIDADEAFRVLSDYYHHRTETQADALREALGLVPEAFVRCKDCMYYDKSREGVAGFHRCSFFLRWEPTGGFCHYAQRRQTTAESE